MFEATLGGIADVNGVTRYMGYENTLDITDSNGIPSHSVSFVVEGGDDARIAQAIWENKSIGCGTYGTTSETVYDEYGNPTIINFYRPINATIGVNIEIEPLTGFLGSTVDLIKKSVSDYINNLQIGDDVYIARLYTPANLLSVPQGETFDITLLEINKNGGAFAAANIDILFNEASICNANTDISVVVAP